MASGGEGTDVWVWELSTGAVSARLRGHAERVTALALLRHDAAALLASAASDGELRVWSVGAQAPCCVAVIPPAGASRTVLHLLALPRLRLAAASVEAVRVWDVSDAMDACAVSVEAGRAQYGAGDADVAPDRHLAPLLSLPSGKINAVAALQDGRIAVGGDASLRLYGGPDAGGNSQASAPLRALKGRRCAVTSLIGLPDGRLAAGCGDGLLRIWNLGASATPSSPSWAGHSDRVAALALLPRGRVASGGWDGCVRLWSALGECEKAFEAHAGRVTHLCCPGADVLVSASGPALRFWRCSDGAALWRCDDAHGRAVTGLLGAPGLDGRLVSVAEDGALKLWNVAALNSRPLHAAHAHEERVTCCCALGGEGHNEHTSPDEHSAEQVPPRVVTGGGDSVARVWCLLTGALLCELRSPGAHTEALCCVAGLPGNATLLTSGEDKLVCVWRQGDSDTPQWTLCNTLRGAGEPQRSLVPLGRTHFVSSGARDVARVWDAAEGTCLRVLQLPGGGPTLCSPLSLASPGCELTSLLACCGALVSTPTLGGAAFYVDDVVRCVLSLPSSRDGARGAHAPAARLAVGTDGGGVHFLRLSLPPAGG